MMSGERRVGDIGQIHVACNRYCLLSSVSVGHNSPPVERLQRGAQSTMLWVYLVGNIE